MESKKAELSINIIILVVIGLVVLAIIIYLVVKSGTNYQDATACSIKGGVCKPNDEVCTELTDSSVAGVCGLNKKCCQPVG